MSGIYGKGPRGKATELAAKIVRSLGYCEACAIGWEPMPTNEPTRLEAAHIIPRRHNGTRTLIENHYCLCSHHHRRFGERGVEWAAFIDATIGREKYDELDARAKRVTKIDWPAEVERLKALLAEVDA